MNDTNHDTTTNRLESLFLKFTKSGRFPNAVLRLESGSRDFSRSFVYGKPGTDDSLTPRDDSPYFIASVTKIFTAAAVLLLQERGRLNLDDPLNRFLDEKQIQGIHVWKGEDLSPRLKIHHLLAQTSGLADYFEQKNERGESILTGILRDGDREWNLDDVLALLKNSLQPKFPPAPEPGAGRKAFYSDSNYQLLGAILENIHEKSLGAIFQEEFFGPLEMNQTYLFGDDATDQKRESPLPIYIKDNVLDIPGAMKSFGPDGGIVSNAPDQIRFLRALFGGKVFRKSETLDGMQGWNRIFFPLEYGLGLMRYKLPRIFSPFQAIPAFLGHSGASASFAFYCPERNFYAAGTFNQLGAPDAPFKLLPRLSRLF